MKKLILPLFAFMTFAANAQFSIQPQIGMEASKTKISSTDFSSFSPMGVQVAPRLSLRMEYKLKTGHGAFVGISTTSSAVEFKFTDPQTARTSYSTSSEDFQLQFEGGYQFTTKPITLRKAVYVNKVVQAPMHRYGGGEQRFGGQGRCGQRGFSGGGGGFRQETYTQQVLKNPGLYMRIKPSIGLAFGQNANEIESITKGGETSHEYNTGLNKALIAGTAFEFGTRNQTKFVVSINYVKGLGDNTQTLTTGSIVKPMTTTFGSKTSGFNLSVGMPITFKKKQEVVQHKQCDRSKGRCGRYKI